MSGRRRKSLSIFRPNLSSLTPIRDAPPSNTSPKETATLKKKLRPSSIFSSSPTNTSTSPLSASSLPENASLSPQNRPRTLQKSNRPSSIFGSLRSNQSLQDDDEALVRADTGITDGQEEHGTTIEAEKMTLLHHGEVQMAGSMFRKRSQYLVLTNTHLLRFKTQAKASEMFPEIPSSMGRSNSIRHSRMSSGGSTQDAHLLADAHAAILLKNVVAAYKLDDGRPYFTIELAHYDEASNQASTMSMQLNDPRDSEVWLMSMRAALTKHRLTETMPFTRREIEYVARAVEADADYDPNHFRMFMVVQRATKSGGRSSSDDLGKLMSNIYYFVIGLQKIHLVPLPKANKSASSTSLVEASGSSHGLMCLSSVYVQSFDDAFQLGFRTPLQPQSSLHLASSSANDVALCVRQAAEYLRPNWTEQPFIWNVPDNLEEALLPVPESDEDNMCFDRTLTAYCVAYRIDPSNIRYTVNYSCEDGPEFELFEPGNPRRPRYTSLELLAILRALRYNETFHSIAFRQTKLDALHGLYDRCGSEHFMWSTKSGQSIKLPRLERTPVMVQELQCLALKSQRLRRVDFSNSLSRRARDIDMAKDSGSGICEALFPLCLLQYTNIDWIVLNGIALAEVDLEYLYAASIKRVSHLRAVEFARCGLDTDMMKISLQGLSHQGDTLESIDLSSNPAMIHPDFLEKSLANMKRLRSLNLSRIHVDTTLDALISVSALTRWKLEFLDVSGTKLNAQSVEAISAYLLTRQSDTLKELRMQQCQLTGDDLATILESMADGRDEPRELHLVVSENRFEKGHSKIVDTVKRSITPTHLTMQMLEYSKEKNFRDLLSAVAANKSLKYLDISRTSVPYDASTATCEQLRLMFENNTTLEELNISGEQAHLEAVTLGRGLPEALQGLESNTSLKVLRIENQALGLPGASALASAIERNNTLVELHCDANEISLQAFTSLVNALKINKSLLYVPLMDHDRAWSRSKIDREVSSMLSKNEATTNPAPVNTSTTSRTTAALRKTLTGGRSLSARSTERQLDPVPGFTQQDVRAAVDSLDHTWDAMLARLQSYLSRNYSLANGLPFDENMNEQLISPNNSRPATSGGLYTALNRARSERTPTMEFDRQLGGGSTQADRDHQLGPEMTIEDLYIGNGLEGIGNMTLDSPTAKDGFNEVLQDAESPPEEGLTMGGAR